MFTFTKEKLQSGYDVVSSNVNDHNGAVKTLMGPSFNGQIGRRHRSWSMCVTPDQAGGATLSRSTRDGAIVRRSPTPATPDSICAISSSRLAVAAAAKSGRTVVSGGV